MKIAVVGAGVNGLSCAHTLAEVGEVTVVHDLPLLGSTSAIATAMWHVYLVDPNDKQNLDWSSRTLQRLLTLRESEPGAGIELVPGVELFRSGRAESPPWADIAVGFAPLGLDELGAFPGAEWGYHIESPTVEMGRYLTWLWSSCSDRGVSFVEQHVETLGQLAGYDVVVNCSGLGARELVLDDELHGVRGQYLVLDPGSVFPSRYIGDDEHPDGMAYMIPRAGEILVGGTEEGTEVVRFEVDEADLLGRGGLYCRGALSDAVVRGRVVGLRPCRRSGRVKFGRDSVDRRLIHNFGHGGSGFSLSWGCAEDVRAIVVGLLPG